MEGTIDVYNAVKEEGSITVDSNWINKFLGTEISKEEMKSALDSLDLKAELQGDDLVITIPTFRIDIAIKEDIAEELTQETFFQAVQCIDRFKGNSSILTWLCGIAKNVWLKDLRKRQEILSTNDHIQEIADEKEVNVQWEQKEILQLIHNMNEPIREVMYLRLVSNLSFAEIGEIIGKTENWTRVTFFRGKQKIVKEILIL